jgi:hypothetical protein
VVRLVVDVVDVDKLKVADVDETVLVVDAVDVVLVLVLESEVADEIVLSVLLGVRVVELSVV